MAQVSSTASTIISQIDANTFLVCRLRVGMALQYMRSGTFACLIICLSVHAAATRDSYSLAERVSTVLDFAALGKHQKHQKSRPICDSKLWREQSLKLIKEVPFAGLFQDLHGESKFEASGLVHVNSSYFVVFDRCNASTRSGLPASFTGA